MAARCATEAFRSVPPAQYIAIEDCDGWWLSGCRSCTSQVSLVQFPVTANLFTFLYFHLLTSKLSIPMRGKSSKHLDQNILSWWMEFSCQPLTESDGILELNCTLLSPTSWYSCDGLLIGVTTPYLVRNTAQTCGRRRALSCKSSIATCNTAVSKVRWACLCIL